MLQSFASSVLSMDPHTVYIIALLLTGVAVGIASGLLGVGGGFLMVPVQIWAMEMIGIDSTIATRVAFGTGLAVMLPTMTSGCYGHSCMGCVLWRPGIALGVSGIFGAFLGGYIAARAPGDLLRMVFGIVVLAGAIRMLLSRSMVPRGGPRDSLLYYAAWGFPVGVVSGLTGVGGGVVLIPVMVLAMGFSILQAVGTSGLAIIFNSVGGVISYALNGLGVQGLPPYSVGYINLLQLALLAGTSVPASQLGVRLAHRLPAQRLRYIFIALMLYIGLQMTGALEWVLGRF